MTPDSIKSGGSILPRLRFQRKQMKQQDWIAGYLFIAPLILGFFAFVAFPILAVFFLSFHNFNLVTSNTFDFNGMENYTRMFLDDPNTGTVAWNSLIFTVGYVLVMVPSGLAAALLVNQRLPGITLFRVAYFVPVVMAISAWVVVWRFLIQPSGGINGFLSIFSIDGPNWLRDPTLAMGVVIIVQMLKNIGIGMVFFLAALQEVPTELKEAARIDGASPFRTFLHITLPLITPVVFLVTVLNIVVALKSLNLIFLMTSGGPGLSTTVLAYYIYSVGFLEFEQGYASALAVVLFLVVLALTIVQFTIRKRWVFYET